MKKKRLFILVGSMLAIPLMALCLIASRAPKEKAAPGEEVKTFHFGNLVALTGNMAALCVPASKGVELAVEEVNEAGGLVVGGQRYMIKLHTYDGR